MQEQEIGFGWNATMGGFACPNIHTVPVVVSRLPMPYTACLGSAEGREIAGPQRLHQCDNNEMPIRCGLAKTRSAVLPGMFGSDRVMPMSTRGMVFLELWMERHLAGAKDAAEQAQRCASDALNAAVSMREMEEEVGPLETFIAAALAQPGQWRGRDN